MANWNSAKVAKRTQELWRRGIPPSIRKDVWIRALEVQRDPSSVAKWEQVMQAIHINRASLLATGTTSETARLVSLLVFVQYLCVLDFVLDISGCAKVFYIFFIIFILL